MKNIYQVLILCTLVLMQGCASIRPYQGKYKENLVLRTTVDPGVHIYLDIYSVNKRCETKFLGTVELGNIKSRVGIAANKYSLLSFRFQSSSFWSSSSSSISFDSLLKPRKGYEYDVYARHVSGIYNVEISEYYKSRKTRQINHRELHECQG